jgi:hypothetical protein
MFRLKVKKCNQQWRDCVKSATTKEKLDKSITEIWSKLGEIGKECFPPILPKTKYAPRWSPKLKAIRKQVNALNRRVNRCKNQDLKDISKTRFKALKNLYKTNLLKPSKTPGKNFVRRASKLRPGKCKKFAKLASQGSQSHHR